jgi:hypothetical protein
MTLRVHSPLRLEPTQARTTLLPSCSTLLGIFRPTRGGDVNRCVDGMRLVLFLLLPRT